MDETIRMYLELDSSKFDDAIHNSKANVESLKDTVSTVSEMSINGSDASGNPASVPLLENKDIFSSVLSKANSSLKQYQTNIQNISSALKNLFNEQVHQLSVQTQMLETDLSEVLLKKNFKNFDKSAFNNKTLSKAAAIQTTSGYLEEMFSGIGNAILNDVKIQRVLPQMSTLANQILSETVKKSRQAVSLSLASNAVANDQRFIDYIEKVSGQQYRNVGERAQAARTLLAASPAARVHLTEGGANLGKMPLIHGVSYFDNVEKLPDSMRKVYGTNGILEGKQSRGSGVLADDKVYHKLIALTNYGENSKLVNYARQVGLMRLNGAHKMQWREHATMDEIDTLAGLVASDLYSTRLGSPLYPRDPRDNPSTSKAVRELNEIIDVLNEEKGLSAGILSKDKISHYGGTKNFKTLNRDYSVKRKNDASDVLRTFRNPDLYIVPQAQIDRKGKLTFSDPKDAARTAQRARMGLGDRDDDNFVAVNESAFTYLLGYTNKDKNTYGTGRDAEGRAAYKNPKIIKVNTSSLVPTDEFGIQIKKNYTEATEREKQLANIVNKGALYVNPKNEQDNSNYRFGWVGASGKGIYMVQKSAYDEVKKRFSEEYGLANPFEAFNEERNGHSGLIVEGDRETTTKQINNVRKGATPAIRLSDYGFRADKIGTIDYKLLDKAYEQMTGRKVSKQEAIDGLAILSEMAAPTSVQGRLFAGAAKFMGQRMSIVDLIGKSKAVNLENLSKSNWTNQLITRNENNKYGFSYWMPSMALRNLSEDEAVKMIIGLTQGTSPEYQGLNAERLRNEYFTDVMSNYDILLSDSAIKNVDQFRVMSQKHYRKLFNLEKGEAIDPSKIDKNGMVKLNKAEHEKYMKIAAQYTGGLWGARTNDDFHVDKDTMAVTTADSIDLPPSIIARSNKIYDAMRKAYSDEGWLYEHFLSNPRFAETIKKDPNWIKSSEARSIINEELEALDTEQNKEHRVRLDVAGYNALAQIYPGTTVERSFEMNKISPDRNSEVAPLFPSLVQEYFSPEQLSLAVNRGILKNGKLDQSRIMYAPGYQHSEAIGGRMPAAPGTYADLINLAFGQKDSSFTKAFAAIGSNDIEQVTLPTQAIYRMNTGDFDGDTIWLYSVMADEMYENLAKMNVNIDEVRARRQKVIDSLPEKIKKKFEVKNERDFGKEAQTNDLGQAVTGAIRGTQLSQSILGAASAGIRNVIAYGDPNDPETANALLALVEYYDKATSEVLNKGEDAQLDNALAREFMMSGRTFKRLMQQIGQEETTGEKRIDNIFKYRTASPTSSRDFADIALLAATRAQTGSDAGLRESLLNYVDRRHTMGTAAHKAAEWYANYIADTESGYKFWSKEEFAQEAGKHITALNGAGDDESLEMARFLQKRAAEVEQGKTLSRETLEDMRDTRLDSTGELARKMLESQATDEDRRLTEQQLVSLNQRRKFAQELKAEQERMLVLNDLDATKMKMIQDTGNLEAFQTSFSVTNVEPWMNGEDARKKLGQYIQSASIVNLAKDPHKIQDTRRLLETPEHFGDVNAIAERQANELLNRSTDSPDMLLGTFMHSGIEDYLTKYASAIADGTFKYEAGELTQLYKDKLTEVTKDQNGNSLSWKNYFEYVGIAMDDITSAFQPGGDFGTTVRAKGSKYVQKMRNIFGLDTGFISDNWFAKDKTGKNIGSPDLLMMSLLSENDYIDPYGEGSGGTDKLKAPKAKRIVMAENKLFNNKGVPNDIENIANSFPIDLPELNMTKFIHAKPDLIYEDENGKYNILDYKSSANGAVEALYQNMIYIKVLESLAKAAYTGKWENGKQVENQKMLEPYKQFMEEIDDGSGNKTYRSKFNGGKIQSFDLLNAETTSIDYNGYAIRDTFEEYYKAARRKAKDLREGYISGKQYLAATGMFQYLGDEDEERQIQEIKQNAAKFDSEDPAIKARRDFLVAQFAEDKNKIPELKGQIFKLQKKYGLVGDSSYINQFSWITDALNGALNKDQMSALYSMYGDSPEIQSIISDMIKGKSGAEQGLRNVITAAAYQDPEEALKTITKMVRGAGESSSAIKTIESMNRVVKTAIGSREALKTEDVWDGVNWKTKARTFEEVGTPEQIEKIKRKNAEEALRAENARIAEETYNNAQYPIDRLLKQQEKLIPEITKNEIAKDRNQLNAIIGTDDPYKKIADSIQEKETQLTEWITAKKAKLEEINAKLEEKNGNIYAVTGTARGALYKEAAELEQIIKESEEYKRSGKESQKVLDKEKERLGMIKQTPEEKTNKWLNERLAVLNKELDLKGYYTKRTAFARNRLNEVEADSQSTIYERLTAEKNFQEAVKKDKKDREKYIDTHSGAYKTYAKYMLDDEKKSKEISERQADMLRTGKVFTRSDLREYETLKRARSLRESKTPEEFAAYVAQHPNWYNEIEQNVDKQMSSNEEIQAMQSDYQYNQMIRSQRMRRLNRYGLTGRSMIGRGLSTYYNNISQAEAEQVKIEGKIKSLENERSVLNPESEKDKPRYDKLTGEINELKNASAAAGNEIESMSGPFGKVNAAAQTFSGTMSRLVSMFGRRIFMRLISQVTQFVKQFDKSMTEIQMITLKTDDQITDLGKNLITKAQETGSSVTEVTSAASALYRQGLNDEQVDERLDDVIKFSKVAGIKTEEATKILTTALQNNLVSTSEEAMDALVALGDTAATTASEIAKGMQKSAAAANDAKVSYGELVTLLTISTSKTQLGGASAGTALNTLFYRLYKVGLGEDYIDENGVHVSSTNVQKALKQAGVGIYNEDGSFRGAYGILTELGSKWDNLDDTTQSLILSQLAMGRQRNNIATLLQGLQEDNGELANKYLTTAETSGGITDEKFDHYLDSLNAKLATTKASFDGLIESLNDQNVGAGFLQGISEILQSLTYLNDKSGGVVASIGAITMALTALMSLMIAHPVGALITGIALIGTGIAASISDFIKANDPEEQYQKRLTEGKEKYSNYYSEVNRVTNIKSQIEETNKLVASYKDLSKSEQEMADIQIESAITSLTSAFPDLTSEIDSNASAIEKWNKIAAGAQSSADELSSRILQHAEILNQINYKDIDKNTKQAVEDLNKEYAATAIETPNFDYVMNVPYEQIYEGLKITGDNSAKADIAKILTNNWYGYGNKETPTSVSQMSEDEFLSYIDKYRTSNNAPPLDFSNPYLHTYLGMSLTKSGYLVRNGQNPQHMYTEEDTAKIKEPIRNLLSWLAESGYLTEANIGKAAREYYSENEFSTLLSDFDVGFKDIENSEITNGIMKYVASVLGQTDKDQLLGVYAEDYNKKYREIFDDALNKYISSNTNIKAGDFDTYKLSAITGAIKQKYANKIAANDYSWINYSELPNVITGFANQLVKSPLAFTQQYADIMLAPYRYSGKGYLTKEQVYDAIRNNYRTLSAQGNPAAKMSASEYFEQEVEKFNNENKTGFFAAIEAGSESYRTTDKNKPGYMADQIYEQIKDIQSIEDLMNKANNGEILNFEAFLKQDATDIAEWLRPYIEQDEATGEWKLKDNIPDNIMDLLRQRVAKKSANYSSAEYQNYLNTADSARAAIEQYYNGAKKEEIGDFETLKSILPEAYISKIERGEEFTGAEKKDIERRISNYGYQINGYTAYQKRSGFETLESVKIGGLNQLLGGPQKDLIDAALSGMSNSAEYLAAAQLLEDTYGSVEKGLKANDNENVLKEYGGIEQFKVWEQEFENLKKETDIEINVDGVKELEKAGKVAEGTTELLKNLQEGGQITIKAKFEFESELGELRQQEALLNNGSYEEQVSAISAITGRSATYVQSHFTEMKSAAQGYVSNQRSLIGSTLDEIAQRDEKWATDLAKAFGYKKDENGNYITDNSIETVEREDLSYGKRKAMSADELAKAQEEIRKGKLSNTQGDYERYQEAYNSMGTQNQKYLGMLAENKALEAQGKKRKYSQDQINAQYKLAVQESNEQKRQGIKSEEEEVLKNNAYANIKGALAYGQYQYNESNKAKLAAQQVYLARNNPQYQNLNTLLASGYDIAGADWYDLLQSSEYQDFARIYLDSNGRLKQGTSEAEAMRAFANLTMDYSGAGRITKTTRAKNAKAAIQGSYNKQYEDYVKDVFGDEIFSQWQENGAIAITPELQRIIDEYVGSTLTAKEKLDRLTGLNLSEGQALTNYLALDENKKFVTEALSGFSNADEYLELLQAKGTAEFDKKGGQERLDILNQQLEEFKKNAKIDFEIEGIQTLEDADKLLKGTVETIKELKKGGSFAAEAMIKQSSELYTQSQLDAMLNSGNQQLIDQAVQQITGISGARYYNNKGEWLTQAQNLQNQKRILTEESLLKEYNSLETGEEKQAFIDSLKGTGWSLEQTQVQGKNRYYTYSPIKFKYNSEDYVFENPYAGKTKEYTSAELAKVRKEILDNNYTPEKIQTLISEGRTDIEAALTSGGRYWNEYQRLMTNGGTEEEIKTAKALAEKEENITRRTEEEQEAIDNARLYDRTSLAGTMGYAKIRYEQANKAGLAANEIIESLAEGNITNLEDFVNLVSDKQLANWSELMDVAPELVDSLDKLGIKVTKEGLDISGVEDFDSALAQLINIISQRSKDYSDMNYQTTEETYNLAEKIKSGGQSDEILAAARQVYGDELVNKIREDQSSIGTYKLTPEDKEAIRRAEQNFLSASEETTYQNYQGLLNLREKVAEGKYNEYVQKGGMTNAQAWIGSSQTGGRYFKIAEALESEGLNIQNLSEYEKNADSIEKVNNALADIGENFDSAKDAAEEFDEELAQKGVIATNKYGKNSQNVASYLAYFSKDATKANAAAKNFNSALTSISNNQYFRKRFAEGKRDSKTLESIAAQTGVDKNVLKKKGSESLIKEQLKNAEEADKEAIQEWANAASESMSETLTQAVQDQGSLTIKGQSINLESGDVSVDFSEASTELAGILSEKEQEFIAMLQQWGLQGLVKISGEGDNITAKIIVNGLGSGSKPSGGGGGGKSAVDKLLEEQKHKMAALEHENKMLQIEEKTYDFKNDYTGYRENIQDQIDMQYKIKDAYTENIAEMEALRKKQKQGSEDWYKLTESIYAAQEALAETNNTINELNAKDITITADKFENKDKPLVHRQNMLDKYAQRMMSEDKFADYVKAAQDRLVSIQEQKTGNEAEIESWKEKLAKYEKDDDSWRQVRDKIWELEEENAELDNQFLQQQLELGQQRLSQIAKVVQQNTQTAAHNQNIASTYGNAYQTGGYRSQYEDMIREQIKANQSIMAENIKAEQSAKAQMATLEEGSTAWFEAQAAVYQYQEAVAQASVSQMELNRALAESDLESVTENYTDATRELSHVNELLQSQAQEYLSTNDYTAYFAAMESYMDNLPQIIDAEQKALETLQKQYDDGMKNGTLDPAMQRQYLDEINNRESELQKLVLERRQQQREINKNRLDKLLEDQDFAASEYDHNIKLIGYETTKYQNNGELTNVNNMIREENKLRQQRIDELNDEIAALEEEHEQFKDGSDEEQRIVEQIKKREEALSSENTQLEKNNKLLEENEKKIMQIRKTLEDAVDKEIEAEKKRQREILSANVSMQNTIVDLLKKSLQDQWNLKKKDLEREKENLNEYKKLITERFNYRKKASQQADKDEELAEYRRQLALIEADPSRTKDAKELRQKISDLEKEQAWTVAEDELNAETERVDDQIEGIDKFVQYNEELLNEILGDANNFADEMNEILTGSFEESYQKILDYMSKENEAFMKSLPDAQKQMIQGWEDTWKKANDIIDSNYAMITSILTDKDSYLDYMRSTNRDYRSYMENGDQNSMNLLERQWSEYYDNYINSIKTGAEFDEHEHTLSDVVSKIDELEDNIFKVNIVDITGTAQGPYGLDNSGIKTIDFSTGKGLTIEDLDDIYKEIEPIAKSESTNTENQQTPGTNKTKKNTTLYSMAELMTGKTNPTSEEILSVGKGPLDTTKRYETDKLVGAEKVTDTVTGKVYEKKFSDQIKDLANLSVGPTQKVINDIIKQAEARINILEKKQKDAVLTTKEDIELEDAKKVKNALMNQYATGGIVDYTGLAWVDGTKSKPESFLDATDTSVLRSMLDTFTYIKNQPYMTHIDPSMVSHNSTVGDINITINQAELKSDADFDNVAKRVGQAFTKELQRNGLNLSGYAFG